MGTNTRKKDGSRRWMWPASLALAVVAASAAAAWWWLAVPATPEIVRTGEQNVLLITIDTLRADALGCYGGAAETPNLDRLAAEGVRFDFAHAHAVLTLPSHASILSGLYPHEHGVRDNSGFRVTPDTVTAATLLKAAGYSTGAFIGGYPLDSQFGLDRGFDLYDDRLDDVGQTSEFVLAERRADVVVGSATAWLSARRSRWFAWVHVFDPHAPYEPPEPYATRYRSNRYAGEVAFVDSALGPLLDKVRAAVDRPTLVIVTGDHGESLGDHGEQSHGLFAYESTLRIPLLVAQVGGSAGTRGPGRTGRVSPAPVQHVDILPTILDGLGLPAPATGRGVSLLREIPDADVRASYFEALSASLNRGWAPLTGVLVGRDKYIDLPIEELYDIAGDPAESRNGSDTRAPVRKMLRARLASFGPSAPGPRQPEDGETTARLRALGYTSGSSPVRTKPYTEDDDPKRLIQLDQDMHRGLELSQAGRMREAETLFRSLVARRPDMSLSHLHLAFLLWEQGRAEEAIAALRHARTVVIGGSEVEWRLGMYLAETGQVREAIPLLETEAARPTAGVDVLNALGIAYDRAGRAATALATFRKALAIDARNAMVWQNIGAVHLHAGDIEAARRAFGQSIEANPKWSASYTGLGVVELQAGNRPAAIEAWRRAVELNPREFDALFNLATELIDGRQNAEARPFVQQFVATAPPSVYAKDIAKLRAWLGPGGM
jgi:arylsulfatase A-like enzyme/tetratricopeptide (TPR) repeat protein